jgi:uncharacterized protein (UPF0332 family)
MTFSWTDYLIVARHLAENSAESGYAEGFLRSAISRAYYAALNTTRGLLSDQWGIEVPETAEIHRFVPRWFMDDEEDPDQQEIGILLDRLCGRRRRADYADEIAIVPSLAARSLADAQIVIDRVLAL